MGSMIHGLARGGRPCLARLRSRPVIHCWHRREHVQLAMRRRKHSSSGGEKMDVKPAAMQLAEVFFGRLLFQLG